MYMHLVRFFLIGFFFFCFAQKLVSQHKYDLSLEFQAYPTGLIPGISFDTKISMHAWLYGRIGYNWIRHGDKGLHEDERGGGLGFSVGYRHYLNALDNGWRFGLKNDIWWNGIDWKEGNSTSHSDVTVIQPTIELAHLFLKNKITFCPTVALGYEVNVSTTGEDTGEGAILLIGFQIGLRKQ
jgi:hypothetical protein